MKTIHFDIDSTQAEWIFSPIRSKTDVIVLLMKAIKLMIVNAKYPADRVVGTVTLQIDKMSRLFFFSEKKYFSINFPFSMKEDQERYKFIFQSVHEVDNKMTSEVLGIIATENFLSGHSVYDFLDLLGELEVENPTIWNFVRSLMLFEDGYVRYDHDEKNANGNIHPPHHIDIFYSQGNSFKLGLQKELIRDSLIDILNINTDCHFLTRG